MSEAGPHLRLICINDVYSLENLPRLSTLIARHRDLAPGGLLLTTLAGDFVAPSLLSSLDGGRGMVDCLNALPVTHVCLGNHEDDIPLAKLHERIAQFRGVWLSTNVLGLDPALQTAHVLELPSSEPGGKPLRVGLIGVVMSDASAYRAAPFGGATMLPANATAVSAAEHLFSAERCDVVIPLTHQSLDADRALAAAPISRPFPLIVGGHEHTPFLELVSGTQLVKAGIDAECAVVVDLRWSSGEGTARSRPAVEAKLVSVASFEEDAAMRARVDGHMRAVRALESATLVHLEPGESLSSEGTRRAQTSLGTLLVSLLRDALGADAAVFNGGGIRANRTYRERFTYGDLKAEVPFDNEVVVAELPGAVLREALLSSRSHAPLESGGFLQVDDAMDVDDAHCLLRVAGAPLDPARVYRVALVQNLLTGMDHVEPLVRYATAHPEIVPPHDSGREVKVVLVEALALHLWAGLGAFDDIDENHDGLLQPAEIAHAVERATREPASELTVDLLLKAVAHHGAAIERAEAEAAAARQRRGRPR